MSGALPKVSVVFLTYNRAHTLVATYETLLALMDYPRDRLELILSDDGSDARNKRIIERLDFDRWLISKTNAGLGASSNKGIRAASGDFILQMQDDWILTGRRDFLRKAVEVLQSMPDIGMILFRDRPELPVRERRQFGGLAVDLLLDRVNAKGVIMRVGDGAYSDNPHLKRRDFHQIVGQYAEGVPMAKMELEMQKQVCAQTTYRVATIGGMNVFKHIGDRFSFDPAKRFAPKLDLIRQFPGGPMVVDLARIIYRKARKSRTDV
ncbi:Glycosyl transferase family 2 [Rhizobiales bacterium GAS113]|nr:Glycosyl transferase family 2 [Rhizobiales bacterium GAS113]